jgi:hypothetical protein
MENIKDWCISRKFGGASDTRLVLRRVRSRKRHSWEQGEIFLPRRETHRGLTGTERLSQLRRQRIASRSRRFGYLVFFRPMAILNPFVHETDDLKSFYPTSTWSRVLIFVLLGGADDHDGTQVHG